MENNYKKDFLRLATSLDAITTGNGEITVAATEVTQGKVEEYAIPFYMKLINILDNAEYSSEIKQIALALREAFFSYIGYCKIKDECLKEKEKTEYDNKTLDELLAELDNLVGLKNVKKEINDLVAFQKVQNLREQEGLLLTRNTLHMAFIGNPGTGKTTVARIVGRIYHHLGILSKGHFLEVSRTDLIAGYQGQTALKVKEVIEKIKGGVLFIDEAYSITENENSDSYGRECLTELTKALEDYRDDLVVIVAGYTEPMATFFESNPGLRSRFNKFIAFDDYNEDELFDIFIRICEQNDYIISEEAKETIKNQIKIELDKKGEYFANGRTVRNLYDDVVMNQARRLSKIDTVTKDMLMEISVEDICNK